MFRLLLFLLCGLSAYSGFPQWLYTRVEVTVMSRHYHLYDYEVQSLFENYGKRHGISSSDTYFYRVKECYGQNRSPARFEARVKNCYDFQTYLLHLGEWMSNENWKLIHVKCGQLDFSVCLVHSCSPKDRIDLANCAYNTAV